MAHQFQEFGPPVIFLPLFEVNDRTILKVASEIVHNNGEPCSSEER